MCALVFLNVIRYFNSRDADNLFLYHNPFRRCLIEFEKSPHIYEQARNDAQGFYRDVTALPTSITYRINSKHHISSGAERGCHTSDID